MRKQERHSHILQEARELADTGRFRGWLQIEFYLRGNGWTEARTVLDDSFIRRELDLACKGKSIYNA